MNPPPCALVVVDVQRYYLDPESSFFRWTCARFPNALEYVSERVRSSVIPAVQRLFSAFRALRWPVAYLRLCGAALDRSDLHRIFRAAHLRAAREGYPDLYPLASDPLADVIPEIAPRPGDAVFDKTTFSGFASGHFSEWMGESGCRVLALAGLATSQCVETTARDASDAGYGILHIEDAQADYSPDEHYASLFASRGVCGGTILSSEEFCGNSAEHVRVLREKELL